MRHVEAAMLTAVVVGFVWVLWHLWRSRQTELQRAERNAELAQLSRTMEGIAHDLQNLMGLITSNLSAASSLKSEDLRQMIEDVERAAWSASRLVEAARGATAPILSSRSVEGIVRLQVALMRREGVPVTLRVSGDFQYRGTDLDAQRVIQNLFANAAREAARFDEGKVIVDLDREALRVTNPVERGLALPASIWEHGVSFRGSSGTGLTVAREAASRIGLTVTDEQGDGQVTFVIRPTPGTYRT